MAYDPARHHRRSIRLRGYDYAKPGAYFVTVCSKERIACFGEVIDGAMKLSPAGVIARDEWLELPKRRPYVTLDEYVVMPNHLHGILWIEPDGDAHAMPEGRAGSGPRRASLAAIVGGYKSGVSRQIRESGGVGAADVWQTGYYEHVIRSEFALVKIREYIANNPARWDYDAENPRAVSIDDANDFIRSINEDTAV